MEDLGANPRRGARLGLLRWLLLPVVVVPLAFVLGFGFGRDPNVLPSALTGRPAPSFELPTLAGSALSSESLRGRPMVINFWASWCLECKTEHPVLMDGQRRYGSDVAFIGVLYQDRPEDARAYLTEMGDAGYPNLIDADGRLALDFGVSGVPETFFIDAQGIVRYKHWGALTTEVLNARLSSLLGSARPAE